MKFVKLNCTRGGLKNPTLAIGDGEGEISLEEAQTLVDERMGVEYFPEVLMGSADAELVKELEESIESYKNQRTELESQLEVLTTRNGELEGQLALLDTKVPVTPPAAGTKPGTK